MLRVAVSQYVGRARGRSVRRPHTEMLTEEERYEDPEKSANPDVRSIPQGVCKTLCQLDLIVGYVG